MSQLVCTDRGDHRRVVLLDQRPDDPLERPKFKVLGPPDADGSLSASAWQEAADHTATWPNYLRCPQCGRNPRPRPQAVRELLAVAAQCPGGQLDLSLLRL